MKIPKNIILLFFITYVSVSGQQFSLKQCIDYAASNSRNIKVAHLNAKISDKVVNEQIGKSLPQIDLNSTIQDNVKITTQVLPGEFFGRPGTFIPIKMGTQYNASAGLSLTQKVFDPSFWVALKAARISREMADQTIQQTDEQTFYSVSSTYYRALILKKQLDNLKLILNASRKTLESSERKFENGIVKKVDVDKIKVSYNNINSQVQQTELSYNQILNNLKFYMGMPVDSSIVLADGLPDNITEITKVVNDENFISKRIDYQIQKTNVTLYEADKQNNIAAYLPRLSFYANYNYQAMRSEFDLFQKGKNWYNSSAIGVQLTIPIFSGFSRFAKVEQSNLNILKAKESLSQTEQSIKVELSNYNIQFQNAVDNIQNEKENLELAESVYKNTQTEFSQGVSSSIDLVQAESSLRETQNNYYNKLLTLYIARLDLEKSRGNLINFINNIK